MALLSAEFRDLLRGPLGRYYGATLCTATGMGLVLSLNVIYLHDVRHLPYAYALTMQSMTAVLGLLLTPLLGTLTDRIGPVRVMIVAMVLNGVAMWQFSTATTELSVLWVFVIFSVATNGYWGPNGTLIARLAGPAHRETAFGVNYMMLNLGIGIGGLVSAAVVDESRPVTFEHLYRGTALLFIVGAVVIATLWRHGNYDRSSHDEEPISGDRTGWREVIADRRLRQFLVAAFMLSLCGYASIDAGVSAFTVHQIGVSVHHIGIMFAFNTFTIIVSQLFILRLIERRSRSLLLALVGVLWCSCWLLLAIGGAVTGVAGFALACLAVSVFAVGETVWAPTAPSVVNDLAPEHVRGRYNAAQGTTFSSAFFVAPLISIVFFSSGTMLLWPIVVGVGAITGGYLALRLRRVLTVAEDGLAPVADAAT
jgi:MFS family permease